MPLVKLWRPKGQAKRVGQAVGVIIGQLKVNSSNQSKGRYGFLLPPEQIEPNSEEVIASFVSLGDELRK